MTRLDFADDLRATVSHAAERLHRMTESEARRRPRPGKWSPAEIIGHLVDSASNNHQRFVRARFRDDLRFDGYEQDAWVEAQAYGAAPWPDLVELWRTFNLHLARVMETTPHDLLHGRRSTHNLDRVAWEVVPADQPVSLAYFMRDYVGHLKHHLRQIDETLADPPRLQRAPAGQPD